MSIETAATFEMTSQVSGMGLSIGSGARMSDFPHALKRCGVALRAAIVAGAHMLLIFWILTQAQGPEPSPPPIARMEVRTIVEVSASGRDAPSPAPAKSEPVAQEPEPAQQVLTSEVPASPEISTPTQPVAPPPRKNPPPVKPRPLPSKAPPPTVAPTQSEPANGVTTGASNTHGAEDVPASAARFDADYLNNPAPVYPTLSRRLREEGTVHLLVLVSETGDPKSVQIRKSSGFDRLDEAALNAVRRWRFVPARRGIVAIAAQVIVPINFRQR